jgi:hypothetical protein
MADALTVAQYVLGRGVGRKEVSTALAALPPGGGGGSGRRGGRLCYSSVGSLSRRMVGAAHLCERSGDEPLGPVTCFWMVLVMMSVRGIMQPRLALSLCVDVLIVGIVRRARCRGHRWRTRAWVRRVLGEKSVEL